ncbi:YhbY family RNA-binding protein [Anaeromyxobacter sp. PSR-1]|uniref:YhbY family RNA-binding protein n=1 Tax=Anaeromyxobacter sp. PSR-1 TaxID=1300915 RepID=UPI0005E586D1|nr:YhbY family RNA-binding protein [Anaeromyxobacter sp. PSR-1]GAO03522.1 putative RNA-binding protein YqeI [Anaeromyxobacter sp. PSR-1]
MPAPTNPKKRALMPSSPLRRALRAAGHHLSPVVQVGKDGLTEAVLRQLHEALLAHELVKMKVGTESPEDRLEIADRLLAEDVQVAQVLGRTVLAYRRHPERPRFEPAPAGAAAERPEPKRAPRKGRRAPARRRAAGEGKGQPAKGRRAPAKGTRPAARRPGPRAKRTRR